MDMSKFSRRASSGPQSMELAPLRRNFKNNMSSIQNPIHPVNEAPTTVLEVPAFLATANVNPAAPQKTVDTEALAAEDLEESLKVRSDPHAQDGMKGKTFSARTPITSARCFRKSDISSFFVGNRPEMCATGVHPLMSPKKKLALFLLSSQETFLLLL